MRSAQPTTLSPAQPSTGARIALVLLCLAPLATHLMPSAGEWAEYDRAAVGRLDWWRPVTCHWAHWSADHLLWSGGTFTALALLGGRRTPGPVLCCTLMSATVIGSALWLLTSLDTYRGLSGIASALFALTAVRMLYEAQHPNARIQRILAGLLLLGFVTKLGFESVTGTSMFVQSDGADVVVVPLAHAVGAAVGLCIGVLGPNTGRDVS